MRKIEEYDKKLFDNKYQDKTFFLNIKDKKINLYVEMLETKRS